MAFSYYNYTGDGTTTQFPVAFPYIRREHVLAAVAGSSATFTFVNSSTIQMDVAPANGAVVRVYRQTPLTAPLVDFADGATLVAADLDTNAKQSIYTQQELSDSQEEGLANVIPNGDKGDITTSAGGTVWAIDAGTVVEAKIGTGAVVEAKIGTGAVTAAKIAAGAFTDSVSSTSTTTIATPNSVKTAYDLATTANTTANAALPKAGGTMTGVITYAAAQPRLVVGSAKAWNWNGLTTNTSIEFAGIPSWVKRFSLVLNGVSTFPNSGTYVTFQLGTSSAYAVNGYISYSSLITQAISTGVTSVGAFSTVTSFVVYWGSESSTRFGTITFTNISDNTWVSDHVFGSALPDLIGTAHGGGRIVLSGTLERVRMTTNAIGTDVFDAGTVNIIYEG
jgi:hypothetical protein